MSYHWLLITFSWFGTASLQYINTASPGADDILDHLDSNLQFPLPYVNYIAPSTQDNFQNEPMEYFPPEVQRKRRTTDISEVRNWLPNLIDTDETFYLRNDDGPVPFTYDESNNTEIDKRNFSPWGGKRGESRMEHMWTWKRAKAIREPSMPKRVRFSPWGGKRSGQMIYKPGSKGSKIIFSTSIPELTRIVSNYSPVGKRFDLTRFQFIPTMDKRHPLKVLTLSAQMDSKTLREALPFKKYLETLPKNFKPGHPYTDVHLKQDGKRKVKFSAWGGKRSPPIIGPIWTPTTPDLKESTLNTIILIRNSPDLEDKSM